MRKLFFCFVFLLSLNNLIGQSFNENLVPGLTKVAYSSAVWGDFDNDGHQDFIVAGINNSSITSTKIYKNNGNNTFSFVANLVSVFHGSISTSDLDNDGLPDLHITGIDNNNSRISKIFINNGSFTFTELNDKLEGVAYSRSALVDFNNDGLVDVTYAGINAEGDRIFRLYKNNGGKKFSSIDYAVEGVSDGSLKWMDFDRDHYPDLLIMGLTNSGSRITRIYRNNQGKKFVAIDPVLESLAFGDAAWGDFNADGYPDILISGIKEDGESTSKIYTNNQKGNFIDSNISLQRLSKSKVTWGDYDNDGFLDAIVIGLNESSNQVYFYKNSGVPSFNFSLTNTGLIGMSDGEIISSDYDDDGDLDILMTGFSNSGVNTKVFTNTTPAINSSPKSPINLTSSPNEDSVLLSWSANPIQDETPDSSLSYNIYIGNKAGVGNILSPLSNIQNGKRNIDMVGNVGLNSSLVIKHLLPGKYYWSVQTIDNACKASEFSEEKSFNICYSLSLGKDTTICKGQILTYSFPEQEGQVINWYRSSGEKLSNKNSFTGSFPESDELIVEFTNTIGCYLTDTLIVTVDKNPVPDFNLGKDTVVCSGNIIYLEAGESKDSTNWYSKKKGLLLTNNSKLNWKALEADTIWAEVYKSYGCLFYDTIVVLVNPLPELNLGKNVMSCYGEVLNFKTYSNSSTTWYSSSKKVISTDHDYSFIANKTDTLYVETVNSEGCSSSDTIIIKVMPLPLVDAGKSLTICYSDSVVLGNPAHINNTLLSYSWTPSSTLNNATVPNPIAKPESTTTYYLTIKDENSCSNIDSVTITVNPVTIINSRRKMDICYGDKLKFAIDVVDGGLYPLTYKWSPSETLSDTTILNPIASPLQTTDYTLLVFSGTCHPDTARFTINVLPLPITNISDDLSIGPGEVANLNISGGIFYEWFPEEGLSAANSSNPQAFPEKTTTYKVITTSETGCKKIDSVTVFVRNNLFIPTLFTPNGDGSNDKFIVSGSGIKEINFKVFNRLGSIVYETSSVEEATSVGWDGRFQGKPLSNGTYNWTIKGKFYDSSPLQFSGKNAGSINLIR